MGKGRFHEFNNLVYYSPNCTDDVFLPQKSREEDSETNIFLSRLKIVESSKPGERSAQDPSETTIKYKFAAIYVSDYQKPRWWTRLWGWTCFIPTKAVFDGILRPLCSAQRPTRLENSEYYSMNLEDICNWSRLENDLHQFYQILEKHLILGYVCPALPWVFGYKRRFKSFSRALQAMERSRDWFMVWVGLISYAIAKAETEELAVMQYPYLRISSWYKAAIKGGCSEAWLDGLMFSCVYTFDKRVRRAGVFLHPDSQTEDQPAVEWFREFSIPLWFPYSHAIHTNPKFVQGLPSATELRALCIQPRDENNQIIPPDPNWIPFFEARDIEIKKMVENATKDDIHSWSTRKKGAPDAAVYEWKENLHGEWVRQKLTRRLAEQVLLSYKPSQTRYCPYYNEHDCCENFVDATTEEERWVDGSDLDDRVLARSSVWIRGQDHENTIMDEDFAYSMEDIWEGNEYSAQIQESFVIVHSTEQEESRTSQLTSYPSLSEFTIPNFKDRIVDEITNVLRLYFGFTGVLPNPLATAELSTKRTTVFLTILGFNWQQQWHEAICGVAGIQAAEAFLAKLASGNTQTLLPQDEENWDLCNTQRECVTLRRRFKCIRRLEPSTGKSLFLFDFGRSATVPWKLGVTSASDALMICRLEESMNELEISRFLLCNGIPFRTLLPTSSLSRLRGTPPARLPIRQEDHIFTAQDYDAYQARLMDFLRSGRRARAALMRGGYSWRLSARDVNFADVEHGPVECSLIRSEMFVVIDSLTGEELIDDALTPAEEELMCGSYSCLTGQGEQLAFKSWFPDPCTFERSGADYGRWTELSEKLYRQIVGQTGRAHHSHGPIEQPKSLQKWRSALHGKNYLRQVLHVVESRSNALLKEHGK